MTYKTNHILHLILTIVLGGLWIPVWLIITMVNQHREYHLIHGDDYVDPYRNRVLVGATFLFVVCVLMYLKTQGAI